MHGQGMAKTMRAPELRKTNAGACHPGIES
jgi:hypothetical protein